MIVLEETLRDRGSRYGAATGLVRTRAEVEVFLATLRSRRRFAKATHHSWAVVLSDGGASRPTMAKLGPGL